jgi:hypothetical protein
VRYHSILDEKLELFMIKRGTSHFLQDHAPCHKSKLVSAGLNERPNITSPTGQATALISVPSRMSG